MDLSEITVGSITTVAIRGRISLPAARTLRTFFDSLIKAHKWSLIVDCREIETLSRDGLKAFIYGLTEARKQGGDLVLVAPSMHAKAVLNVTDAMNLFTIFEDIATAKLHFSSLIE
jgi:anti-anti-sigma factor